MGMTSPVKGSQARALVLPTSARHAPTAPATAADDNRRKTRREQARKVVLFKKKTQLRSEESVISSNLIINVKTRN